MQEALVAAHPTWPRDGIPDNPRPGSSPRRPGGSSTSSAARRPGGGASRTGRRARRRRRRGRAAGRLPRRPADVLPPGAVARLGRGAHPARRGRPDDGRDRRGLPRARNRRWRNASRAPSAPCTRRARRSSCRRATSSATGCGAPSPWSTSCTTRATRRAPGPTSPAPTGPRRRSGWGGWCTGCSPTTPRPPPCSR